MDFIFSLQPTILFGRGKVKELGEICRQKKWKNGILVCDPLFEKNGLADEVIRYSDGLLCSKFSDITPNPTVQNVDDCSRIMQQNGVDFVVALGGGSSMDCAKAASVICGKGNSTRYYHSEGGTIEGKGIPLIAIPTTAGTGSEVTNVAVLTDTEKNCKKPLAHDSMYAQIALIDPELTASVPPQVVASTGLDVLSHALEAYWSLKHQPICDACAIYAAKLVFENLFTAYSEPDNMDAKEQMCVASVMAGIAFSLPKTAASHACSFPLTNTYKIPHGEACAFTLDYLLLLNAEAEDKRLTTFAQMVGFSTVEEMAAEIARMKKTMKMRTTLAAAGIKKEDLESLAKACKHPNMDNNPVAMDFAETIKMLESFA